MGDGIAWFLRMLWACRVSIISGVAGVFLFAWAVPAQNLLDDLSFAPKDGLAIGEVSFWFAVFVATIVLWALPIHFGARLTLDDDGWILSRAQAAALPPGGRAQTALAVRQRFAWLIRWLPRVLGFLPFVALAIGLYLGSQTDKGASALREGPLTHDQALWLPLFDLASAVTYLAIVVLRRPWIDRMEAMGRGRTLTFFAIGSTAITTLFFIAAYLAPILVSTYAPRALIVAPLFGSIVLLLSWIQVITHRTGLPLLFLLVVIVAAGSGLNVHFHDLRTLKRTQPGDERLSVHDAANRWMAANGCSPDKCEKRPVVVAIDGGASRAAFTAATFIGALLDRTDPAPGEAATPGRRLFAISGVSGGAYAAVIIQTAIRDAQENGAAAVSPCKIVDRTWFGFPYSTQTSRRFRWQECLQALTSGDYLTPTIVGLAFRDFLAPPHSPVPIQDRATLLEQAWERHYDEVVYGRSRTCSNNDDTYGLCRRMAHPKPFIDQPGHWMPLLVLNGTSVRTGRRILSSDIAAGRPPKDDYPLLFSEAYDLAEAMSSRCRPPIPRRKPSLESATDINTENAISGHSVRTNEHGVCAGAIAPDGPDIRLSTAALISARFPIISPAGAFQMKDHSPDALVNDAFGDQVVDGGYFENSGLTTALEIVKALKAEHLHPLLVSIANEPTLSDAEDAQAATPGTQTKVEKNAGQSDESDDAGLPRRPSTTPLVLTPDNDFWARVFGFLRAPLEALTATRDGHASAAEAKAEMTFPNCSGFYRLRVEQMPELAAVQNPDPYDTAYCSEIWKREARQKLSMARVSMSWWLSALVQADLDAQKCSIVNQTTMNDLMAKLAGRTTDRCPAEAAQATTPGQPSAR